MRTIRRTLRGTKAVKISVAKSAMPTNDLAMIWAVDRQGAAMIDPSADIRIGLSIQSIEIYLTLDRQNTGPSIYYDV